MHCRCHDRRFVRQQVYCAHEYTAANAKFATHVNPNNAALKQRQQEVTALRKTVRH